MSDADLLAPEHASSVPAMFVARVAATPDSEAFRFPVGSSWKSMTWRESADRVYAIAAGLIALGILPEERVAILSTTRVEWILADLGIGCAGAVTTTVYPTSSADECNYILGDSGS